MNIDHWGHTCVVGICWGDEGKGKIVDLLAPRFDLTVRYNGGANAGHTVRTADRSYAFHTMPSGILHPGVTCVIGPGVVLDPPGLLAEIDDLRRAGLTVADNLRLSTRAHVVMPWHKLEDRLSEARLAPAAKIGTTAKGIGPCYADKMSRSFGIRVCDLIEPARLRERLDAVVPRKREYLRAMYAEQTSLDPAELFTEYATYAKRLAPHVTDTTRLLRDADASGRRVLYEGANGTLLDVDHGTYPYVTSSSASALGLFTGAGVTARMVKTVLGVTKAYWTRVGEGPFPTELHDQTGARIREQGHEYGTTTGRPRRIGWFDAVAGRYAVEVSGVTDLAVMHLDTLGGLPEIAICTAYEDAHGRPAAMPADAAELAALTPRYERLPGWSEDLSVCRAESDLPDTVRRYLARLEELLGVPIRILSIGPQREQTIWR